MPIQFELVLHNCEGFRATITPPFEDEDAELAHFWQLYHVSIKPCAIVVRPRIVNDTPIAYTTAAQLEGVRHEPGVTFRCRNCGKVKDVQYDGGTGYARDEADFLVCYDCCGDIDRQYMIDHGKITLYMTIQSDGPLGRKARRGYYDRAKLGNWPGTLQFSTGSVKVGYHSIAGNRYDCWFVGPDKHVWHAVQYGDNTQIAHCKRTKERTDR